MAKGDQIYVMRQMPLVPHTYQHHGIDCGDGSVIHYRKAGEATITLNAIAEFAQNQPIRTKLYTTAFLPEIVVNRAISRLGEQQYDLFTNNCEHFATWCKVGRSESAQLVNYGLYPEVLDFAESRPLIDRATYEADPARSLELFKQAIVNLYEAEKQVRPQYQQTQADIDTWHRVALLALKRDRMDLARAALQRKYDAKQKLKRLQPQMDQIEAIRQNLQANSDVLRRRLEMSTPTI